jgi:hypothetical protein
LKRPRADPRDLGDVGKSRGSLVEVSRQHQLEQIDDVVGGRAVLVVPRRRKRRISYRDITVGSLAYGIQKRIELARALILRRRCSCRTSRSPGCTLSWAKPSAPVSSTRPRRSPQRGLRSA